VAERLAHFTKRGTLDAPDPRLAADHFSALTTLLACNQHPDPAHADLDEVRQTMIDGTHAVYACLRRQALNRTGHRRR